MTGIRIPSHNPEDWFLGVIKFFDSRKDFGYIASNNCGMRLATYEQDFWVNSDCFTDSSAKVEGALVVFQWEHQGVYYSWWICIQNSDPFFIRENGKDLDPFRF